MLFSRSAAAAAAAAVAPSPYRAVSSAFAAAAGIDDASLHISPWRVTAVLQNLHVRRITALAFHPSAAHASLLVAADKSGGMSVWDTLRRRSRRQLFAPHRWQINGFDWHAPSGPGVVVSASADGTVAAVDLDAGAATQTLLDLNPGQFWSEEAATAGRWRMATAVSAGGLGPTPGGLVFVGDDSGRVWALDRRIPGACVGSAVVMRRGGKVSSVHAYPGGAPLLLTAGNDRVMRVWDVRALRWAGTPAAPLSAPACDAPTAVPVSMHEHPRPVTSAYWSAQGSRVVSTAIDNRLRVWDRAALLGCTVGSDGGARLAPPHRTCEDRPGEAGGMRWYL